MTINENHGRERRKPLKWWNLNRRLNETYLKKNKKYKRTKVGVVVVVVVSPWERSREADPEEEEEEEAERERESKQESLLAAISTELRLPQTQTLILYIPLW